MWTVYTVRDFLHPELSCVVQQWGSVPWYSWGHKTLYLSLLWVWSSHVKWNRWFLDAKMSMSWHMNPVQTETHILRKATIWSVVTERELLFHQYHVNKNGKGLTTSIKQDISQENTGYKWFLSKKEKIKSGWQYKTEIPPLMLKQKDPKFESSVGNLVKQSQNKITRTEDVAQ